MIRWSFGSGSDSLDYWRYVAKAERKTLDELATEHDFEIPRPIPGVLDSWIAFLKVYDCRHFGGMGVPTTPQWGDIATRLSVHGLWSAEREEHLTILFRELLTIEAEKRKQDGIGDGKSNRKFPA